jgi:hypothetical protein
LVLIFRRNFIKVLLVCLFHLILSVKREKMDRIAIDLLADTFSFWPRTIISVLCLSPAIRTRIIKRLDAVARAFREIGISLHLNCTLEDISLALGHI